MGTGIVVASQGYVVTNSHVVESSPEVEVGLPDGREIAESVTGEDPLTDLAVVRAEARDLSAVRLADSDQVRVGQFALAIGNSLGLPGGPTVTLGVVSAIGRPLPGADFVLEGLLQTDAAINPGNSGGPLANLQGEIIGINAAMLPYAQGVGFAIPSNTIRRVVDQILEQGRVVRPWLGISGVEVDSRVARQHELSVREGVLVLEVADGGPADQSGVRPGDVVQEIGPYRVKSLKGLLRGLANIPIGGIVNVGLMRGQRSFTQLVRVRESPAMPAS
jgi:S1-C subfamily serine protease